MEMGHIPTGKDTISARPSATIRGDHFALDPDILWKKCQIGLLADGGDDGIHRYREMGIGNGNRPSPPRLVLLSQLHLSALQLSHPPPLPDDLGWPGEVAYFNPLFQRSGNLLIEGGHLIPRSPIQDEGVSPQPQNRSRHIHGRISPSDHRYPSPHPGLLP